MFVEKAMMVRNILGLLMEVEESCKTRDDAVVNGEERSSQSARALEDPNAFLALFVAIKRLKGLR